MKTLIEFKKGLYKQKPTAYLMKVDSAGIWYKAMLKYKNEEDMEISNMIYFVVPFNEIGDATFEPEMESHLLIRYINH